MRWAAPLALLWLAGMFAFFGLVAEGEYRSVRCPGESNTCADAGFAATMGLGGAVMFGAMAVLSVFRARR